MRIVIIGGTGNAGSALVERLRDEPDIDTIVAVARREPRPGFCDDRVQFQAADIASDDLSAIVRGADAVVHLAWLIQPSHDPELLDAVNVAGTQRVLNAVGAEAIPTLVYASSIGTYAPEPSDGAAVREDWPTTGIPTNLYSRQKATTEAQLDAFEAAHPAVRVVRMRPGLIFQRAAATGIRRLFAGPLLPSWLVEPDRVRLVPHIRGLATQAVHAADLADAYARVLLEPTARGAYNVAAEPVLTPELLAETLGARLVPTPRRLARAAAEGTWRAHLQPTPGSWLDLALDTPLMDTSRVRDELGWQPERTSIEALIELMRGMAEHADGATPPLSAASSGPARAREFATGIGERDTTPESRSHG